MRRQIGVNKVPAYSGKYVYLDERGSALAQGPCQFSFDTETCTITPVSGAALMFDLGDIDRLISGDWDLQCALSTGRTLTLQQFGKAFGEMRDGLAHAWCDRTVRCLLLEDLEEVARFNGTVARGISDAVPAEIRLYKSNLAILPEAGTPFQWRLAQVDSTAFDQASYTVLLRPSGIRRTSCCRRSASRNGTIRCKASAERARRAVSVSWSLAINSSVFLANLPMTMRSAPDCSKTVYEAWSNAVESTCARRH